MPDYVYGCAVFNLVVNLAGFNPCTYSPKALAKYKAPRLTSSPALPIQLRPVATQ
jgi:hypothetical protein